MIQALLKIIKQVLLQNQYNFLKMITVLIIKTLYWLQRCLLRKTIILIIKNDYIDYKRWVYWLQDYYMFIRFLYWLPKITALTPTDDCTHYKTTLLIIRFFYWLQKILITNDRYTNQKYCCTNYLSLLYWFLPITVLITKDNWLQNYCIDYKLLY